jgi:hypothetical protein
MTEDPTDKPQSDTGDSTANGGVETGDIGNTSPNSSPKRKKKVEKEARSKESQSPSKKVMEAWGEADKINETMKSGGYSKD